ncbi:hypothetical protein D3C78_1147340 [compost metagenome]
MACINGKTIDSVVEKKSRRKESYHFIPDLLYRYRNVLRSRINVGPSNKPCHCRILEMVGSSLMGRRFL